MPKRSNRLRVITDLGLGLLAVWCYGYAYNALLYSRSFFVVLCFWLDRLLWGAPLLFLMLAIVSAHRAQYYLSPSRPPIHWGSIRWYEGAAIIAMAYAAVETTSSILLGGRFASFLLEDRLYVMRRYLFSGRTTVVLGPVPEVSNIPSIFLIGALPILVGISIAQWMTAGKRSQAVSPPLAPVDYEKIRRDFFSSEGLLESLRTAVPNNADDEKLGLVGVPWLLASVIERQRRFRKSTAIFLKTTVGLAVFLLGVLLWLGYALINDDATGLARRTTAVEGLLVSIDNKLSDLIVNHNLRQERFHDLNALLQGASRYGLESDAPGEAKAALDADAKKLISEVPDHTLADIQRSLQAFLSLPILKDWPQKEELSKFSASLGEIEKRQELLIDKLDSHVPELRRQADDLRQKLSEPESRIPDLIKRIAVGLLVISFMAAVLGYSTRLYQQHLSQVIAAEQDEQAVRRYYVAFKGAEDRPELRGAVLAEFMRWSASGLAEGSGATQSSLSTPAATLAAEILKAVRQVQGTANGG